MYSNILIRFVGFIALLGSFSAPVLAVTPGVNWKDSYSVNGQCYCDTTYDHDAGTLIVDTPQGQKTTFEICETIGPGPGAEGNPIYNDLQCGNGPGNGALDEDVCPGRVDIGKDGCNVIGPTWNLELYFPAPETPTEGGTTNNPPVDEPDPEALSRTPPADSVLYAFNSFSSKDSRWVLIDANSVANANGTDPDDAHLESTSNNAYLELLPDTKASHTDVANTENVWPAPGTGPQIHYTINFDQAGVYEVYFRSYSNNQFDDGIHIGFDGIWPTSGTDVVGCGIRGHWVWNHCEETAPPTLTIPTSGVHTIQFAAREDGFELDHFALRLRDPISEPSTEPSNESGNSENASSSENGNETNSETGTDNTEQAEPELGQAIMVGGSVAFVSQAATTLVLLLMGFGLLMLRRKD